MKVKVKWYNKNPFVPNLRDLTRVSEADVPDDMSFEKIEAFAKEATPEGFFLNEIHLPDATYRYTFQGFRTVEDNL